MCRRSCCKQSGDGAGIAAVAVIAAAVYVSAEIGPVAAKVLHLAVEVLTIFTLTAVAALAAILVTWATARIVGRRRALRQATPPPVAPAAWRPIDQADSEPACLACGGTGMVLRAIGPGRYQDQSCPACQPLHRAG